MLREGKSDLVEVYLTVVLREGKYHLMVVYFTIVSLFILVFIKADNTKLRTSATPRTGLQLM